ncbi:MAG TPA: twin-arginine translocase TatA/TatE family subunit [Bacteroidales bacterium]|nr:twin-arginine translocase TatA/TatE family subunit [Bacteroidales bacterium]HSA44139.1 twin-arginine translocase TatA/TatE family subunit [Bacteroidales bacterium]
MLLFFDISGGELLVILVVAFLVFGPRRMPEIARHIGKGMNDLKKVTSDITREFRDGTADIRKEISQETTRIAAEGRKLKEEILSGPSDIGTAASEILSTPTPDDADAPPEATGSQAAAEDGTRESTEPDSAGQPLK